MLHYEASPSLATTLVQLGLNIRSPLTNTFLYRNTLRTLQYLTITCLEISFIVNKLSQYMQKPTEVHWTACKRVLRYLKGTSHYGLFIRPSANLFLYGFTDADWASNIDDRRSTGGYCIYLGSNLVSWSSRKQHVVARSSTEFEYRALAHGAAETSWLQSLLQELRVSPSSPPVLWCDNISAGSLAANPVFHARTKHIEIDVHFVHDMVLQKSLEVRYVPSSDQIADVLTKVLPTARFLFLRDKLNVRPLPSRLRGDVRQSDNVG